MLRRLASLTACAIVLVAGCKKESASTTQPAAGSSILKINGSTTVNLVAAEACEILRAEKGMNIQIDTQGGSAGGISMLGDGLVQIGMISKHLSEDDQKKYP